MTLLLDTHVLLRWLFGLAAGALPRHHSDPFDRMAHRAGRAYDVTMLS